jgi:hypothetical protein
MFNVSKISNIIVGRGTIMRAMMQMRRTATRRSAIENRFIILFISKLIGKAILE